MDLDCMKTILEISKYSDYRAVCDFGTYNSKTVSCKNRSF